MQHLQVKAAATTTDKGEFAAIAAAWTVDRVKDQIVSGAFAKTIKAWQESGKMIPLHWDHRGDPHDIIGSIDPASMRETKDGLYVEGRVDLDSSEVAREAWRSMKNNALALSFGYLATQTKKEGQITKLLEIDLFEISIVPAPANADTRILSLKSVLKAVWSTAFINDLPDSSFLYIEPGGTKDEDGKTTPRSLRHFPVKDAQGNVDMPHLRNALSRIPQSSLPQAVKDRCTAKAQRMMDAAKSLKAMSMDQRKDMASRMREMADMMSAEEMPMSEAEMAQRMRAMADEMADDMGKSFEDVQSVQALLDDEFPGHKIVSLSEEKSEDPLRRRTYALALEASGGDPHARYVEPEPAPEPEPLDAAELRRRSERAALDIALG